MVMPSRGSGCKLDWHKCILKQRVASPRGWQKEVCPLIAKPAAVAHDFRQVVPSSAKPIRSAIRPKRSLVTVSPGHRNSGSAIAII